MVIIVIVDAKMSLAQTRRQESASRFVLPVYDKGGTDKGASKNNREAERISQLQQHEEDRHLPDSHKH
jgi:hypothetical protein